MKKLIAYSLCALVGTAGTVRGVERGVWLYSIPSEYHGAANIIGNAAREDEAISFMRDWQIGRVYGSYGAMTTDTPAAIATWNRKLAQAGIQSYVEISGPNRSFPENRPGLVSMVDDRLINFNAARSDPRERFVGIEMDIEPWTTDTWAGRTTVERRDMLLDLRDAYASVRQRADAAGLTSAKLSAALPIFFDTTATVGWTNRAEVDQWFSDIGASLDEISVMPYETNSVATIMSRSSYELSHFPGTTYVALRTRLDLEWASMDQFNAAMASVETQSGRGVDIENYYRLRNSLPEPGVGMAAAALALVTRRPRRCTLEGCRRPSPASRSAS
jgi:hypothetical protein